MDKHSKKITIISSCVLMLLGIIAVPRVSSADEISVTGNGSSSNNTVNITSSQQTTTQQTNNSQVTNTTNTTANTGNNSVLNNSGDASTVKTGDAAASTSVANTANSSTITANCGCDQSSTAVVSGNGASSTNNVNVTTNNNTDVGVNQAADITNNVSNKAITGKNTANNNNGNVIIKTGNITAQTLIESGPINIANISVPGETGGLFDIKISGNGANSINTVNKNNTNTTFITVANSESIINNLKEKYITGENSANNNIGNVAIVTGNVLAQVVVENAVNSSNISINCYCQKEHTKPSTPPVPTPTQPANNNVPASSSSSTSSSSSGGSSSGGPGSVLGASANSLPVTGSYWFFIAFIGNILMMLLGGYLRLRSGRSPGFAFAI